MSTISDRHNVVPFVSGESKPFSGQRLTKVGYKKSEGKTAKFPSVCASVPVFEEQTILDVAHRFVPQIRELLENVQDQIFRADYEASEGKLSSLSDSAISIDSILGFLAAEAAGGRITKEVISSWYDLHVKDSMLVVIAERLGFTELTDAELGVVNKQVNMFRDLVCTLANSKVILTAQQRKGCLKVFELCAVDGEKLCTQLQNRVTEMEKRETLLTELLEF